MHSGMWPRGSFSRRGILTYRILKSIRQGGIKSFLLPLYAGMCRGHLLQASGARLRRYICLLNKGR